MKKTIIGKVDLDTCGTAYLLGVSREDEVEVLRSGQATEEDLANPNILCIEVGGSGQTKLNNWDHHEGEILSSATQQVFEKVPLEELEKNLRSVGAGEGDSAWESAVSNLVEYINKIDTEGPETLGHREESKPFLTDVFYGMFLVERNPVEQLHRGVEILREVVRRGIDAYGRMPVEEIPEWAAFASAKAENDRRVAEAVERAQWGETHSGLKLAHLETDFVGAPGALYEAGAQVVVAYSRHFGPAKVPKFTIAGNGVKVNGVLPRLNSLEPGWGGPRSGTILGSPRGGSKLSLDEVVRVVRETL